LWGGRLEGVIVHSDQGTQCPSIGFGQDAKLLITTGGTLDYLANIEQAYIVGREIDMQDIHRFFFEKYVEKLLQQIRVIS
jgi:hypothetical protein